MATCDSSGNLTDELVLATDFSLPRDMASGSGIDKVDLNSEGELEGAVSGCACPECGSPMSVRYWLMVADCWKCGCSIELTEEMEANLRRQMEASRREEDSQRFLEALPQFAPPDTEPEPEPAPAPPPPEKKKSQPRPRPQPSAAPQPAASPQAPPKPQPQPEPQRPKQPIKRRGKSIAAIKKSYGVHKRLEEIREEGSTTVWMRERFREMPAWLTSLVFHLILLILLAQFYSELEDNEHEFALSARIDAIDVVGDPEQKQEVFEPTPFEAPSETQVEELSKTVLDTQDTNPFSEQSSTALLDIQPEPMTDLGAVDMLPGAVGMFDGRGQKSRGQLVQAYGGTTATEEAVARGLKWLAEQQNDDGSWSLHKFGGTHSDTSGTALGVLPFLGAGQTHRMGQYQTTVKKALDWLVKAQNPDGDMRGAGDGRMYAHAQCAIALSEAFALTNDGSLRGPAQKAIDFIVKAQHKAGGWRYNPGDAGDTSVVGWQLLALRSGQMAYLNVPVETFRRTVAYLDSAQANGNKVGSRYSYQPHGNETPTMTAEGLLCRQYTGWSRNHPGLVEGTVWLLKKHPPRKQTLDMYYMYYATQVMHHQGGELWREWNSAMQTALLESQEKDGSWTPRRSHDPRGGKIYMTSLCVLTLEVYYRHLPLYEQRAVADVKANAPPSNSQASVPPRKAPAKKDPAKKPSSRNQRKRAFDPLGNNAQE